MGRAIYNKNGRDFDTFMYEIVLDKNVFCQNRMKRNFDKCRDLSRVASGGLHFGCSCTVEGNITNVYVSAVEWSL